MVRDLTPKALLDNWAHHEHNEACREKGLDLWRSAELPLAW